MDDLIVFRKAYEYMFWLRPTVERFTRLHRYGLGAEMEQTALRLLRHIIVANYSQAKAARIGQALVEFELLRIYLRLSFEYHLLSERQFAHGSNSLEEIARLLRGWLKTAA